MPQRIPEENQRRFAELLESYLTKSGRKRVELARACHWDASMVTKILRLQARPNLAVFIQFMAPFLVANGGITHARQVIEMVELLGGALDETDLQTIATTAERIQDPLQNQSYFRDRATAFRQTISTDLNNMTAVMETSTELTTRTGFGVEVAQAVGAELETTEVELASTVAEPDLAEVAPTRDRPRILAEWQAVVSQHVPTKPDEWLEPDEVIAAVLERESQLADSALAETMWNWLGQAKRAEKLRQKTRLEFVLKRFNADRTWNQLEWEWLDWVVAETARRNTGQAQLSPRQLASFIADLGQIAFEAVKQNDGKALPLTVDLNDARSTLPVTQGATWDWLRRVAELGPVSMTITDNTCQFASRDEAEFLAAQYLLEAASDDDINRIVKNAGRPFGVLRQMVRILHFTGKDESVRAIVEGLLAISDVIPLRYLDAASLLVACDGVDSKVLYPLWAQVEETLCQSWIETDAPEYRAAVAKVMHELQSARFRVSLQSALMTSPMWGSTWKTALRDLAKLGGAEALETLRATAESIPPDNALEYQPLSVVLSVARLLPSTDEATLLTALALHEAEYDAQCLAVSALAKAGTVPALRALQHIARKATRLKTQRYAETRLGLLYSPAQAALIARELDMARPADDAIAFHGLLQHAKSLLHRSVWVEQNQSGQANAGNLSRTLSRALARIWANLNIEESFRVEVGLTLMSTHADPAFEICLGALPLVDDADRYRAGRTERLLVSLAPKTAAAWLWQLVDKALTPAQSVVIILCLGRAGGMAADERFEQLLTQSDEAFAIAAVGALADSLGQAAGNRLWQVAEINDRPDVRMAAFEGLAVIGSEKALPYLKEKLSSHDGYADTCFQLARLRHPDAEQLLAQVTWAAGNESRRDAVYLPALAIAGGAMAVQSIYDLVGPQPNELALSHLRDQFADDTVTRASEVWGKLVNDPSPDWRMMAADVLSRDKTQSLIEYVVRMALEDNDMRARVHARACLQWNAPTITSEPAIGYILDRLEQQVSSFGIADEYLLELLQKCLSGLVMSEEHLPAEIVHRTLALLWPMLSQAQPTDEVIILLLTVFAHPEFVEAAGDVARLLEQDAEARVQREALETLIAMRATGLFEILLHLARSSHWPEVGEYACRCLAEMADFRSLLDLSNDLRPIVYQAAILRDVRFQREMFHQKTVFANGRWERV